MMLKRWGEDTVRGGQTVFHGLRMWAQLARAALLLMAVPAVAAPAVQFWLNVPGYEVYAAAMLTLAETKLAFGYAPGSGQEVRLAGGAAVTMRIADIAALAPWHAARNNIVATAVSGAWLGARIGAGTVVGVLAWFRFRGRRLKRRQRVRGAELVSARRLRGQVDPLAGRVARRIAGAQPPYRVAGVPYPDRAETQHTLVSGTTGSGKTVLISGLVEQIRRRGDRCVIYDKMGSYTQTFFDPQRDTLLNPLDARAPRWSPFFEARSPGDFDNMAAALIPQQKDTVDPFWVTAARQLFSHGAAGLWQQGERKNRALVDHLLKTDLTALARAMEGTVAQSIVDENNPKTALSVRAMLTANIGAMEVLADRGEPFSIREWISADEDRESSFLFLTSRGDQHASLRGLISTWLEIAVNALLSLEHEVERRIWVILDELPTLHRVPSLQPGLAESRQFGGCFVLGVQVASALRSIYGRDGAQTISSLCGTRAVLAAPDRDTAQWSAESLGRAEVEAFAEGVSYGAEPYRDGVTLTPKRELRSLVLPSQIMRLENLHGFLKLRGRHPVARIELKYVRRRKVAPRFVPAGAAHGGPASGGTAGPVRDAPPGTDGESGDGAARRRAKANRGSKSSAADPKNTVETAVPVGAAPYECAAAAAGFSSDGGEDAAGDVGEPDRKKSDRRPSKRRSPKGLIPT